MELFQKFYLFISLKGSFIVSSLTFDGPMNKTFYIIVYSQSITPNLTNFTKFTNEIVDENMNYYVSIPLTFSKCPEGYIYMFLENQF